MTTQFRTVLAALAFGAITLPVHAGDPEAGANAFSQCQTCHVVANDAGEVLAGRNARTGPNLYGLVGRAAGSVDGFRYGASLKEAGEKGLIWDEETLVAYLQDPADFLKTTLGNNRARSQMSFRVKGEDVARDLYAFLATFSEVVEEEEAPKTN
jgi:cytochrome c